MSSKPDLNNLTSQTPTRRVGVETWYHVEDDQTHHFEETSKSGTPKNSLAVLPERSASEPECVESLIQRIPPERQWIRKSPVSQQFFLDSGLAITFDTTDGQEWSGSVKIASAECNHFNQLLQSLDQGDITAKNLLCPKEGEAKIFKGGQSRKPFQTRCHENYETLVASGMWLIAYRFMIHIILAFGKIAKLLTSGCILLLIFSRWPQSKRRSPITSEEAVALMDQAPNFIRRTVLLVAQLAHQPTVWLIRWTGKHIAFRTQRQNLSAFLITRPVLFGTGHLAEDGRYFLGHAANFSRGMVGTGTAAAESPVFLYSHWVKACCQGVFQTRNAGRDLLFSHQRLQIGLSDTNSSNETTCLKVCMTALIIEMIEKGSADSFPVFHSPLRALREVNADWYLVKNYPTSFGKLSAIDIQRIYWNAANRYVSSLTAENATPYHPVLKDWMRIIERVEKVQESGIEKKDDGVSVDWITKRIMIESVSPTKGLAAKCDLAASYHHLPLQKNNRSEKPNKENVHHETSHDYPESRVGRTHFIQTHQRCKGEIEIGWNYAIKSDDSSTELIPFESIRD